MNNNITEVSQGAVEQAVPAGYKQTEVGVIPEDWDAFTLGDVGTFKNGINKGADDFGYGYPFVNLMDVFGKPTISRESHLGLINSTDLDKKEYSLIRGDVLFIRSSVKPTGVGLTTVLLNDLNKTVYSGFLIRFRSSRELELAFKIYCFYEEGFRKRIIAGSTVSANTNINQDVLKAIPLAIPRMLEEQTAIANALSDVDALLDSLEALIAKKQAIKTATMQQLLTGRTRLPQFALNADGSKKGSKSSELGEIPEDWNLNTLNQLATIKSGGTPSTAINDYWDGNINWCTPTDITALRGKKYLSNTSRKITEQGVASSAAEILPSGAVIMTSRATIGECAIAAVPMATNQGFKNFLCGDNSDNEFLYYLLSNLTDRFISLCSGSTFLEISTTQVRSFNVAVPPKLEQTAIATILSDMDEELQALEQQLSKTRQLKQGMMQQLLTGKIRLVTPA